mgnify:FL=1
MQTKLYNQLLQEVLEETAEVLLTGRTGQKVSLGLTTYGSEIAAEELLDGALIAMKKETGLQVSIIGPGPPGCDLPVYKAGSDEEVHDILGELLAKKELDGAVAMHYPFPIGVSTIGKVVTPARGRKMYIASTTGTSDTDRVQAMVKNAVYGIAAAKADGIKEPSLGILNVDGARQTERHLLQMQNRGYSFRWGESQRAEGGHILRGNDLLTGNVDVVVCDTLTGNILMKMFSSFTSGGNYETAGCGYGPGIGAETRDLIAIISRASGTPVVANALCYCASMVRSNISKIQKEEIEKAKKAGWQIPAGPPSVAGKSDEIMPPAAKVTADEIPGIDIMELDDAVRSLWKEQIFAATGMGCTGPIILIAAEDKERALKVLQDGGFVG